MPLTADGEALDDASPSHLIVVRVGSTVPQSSTIHLKTRTKPSADWADLVPQLLIAGTRHLYIGRHEKGTFQRVRKDDVEEESFEGRRVAAIRKFERLALALKDIRDLVIKLEKEKGRKKMSLIFAEGELKLYKRDDDADGVPEGMLKRFLKA